MYKSKIYRDDNGKPVFNLKRNGQDLWVVELDYVNNIRLDPSTRKILVSVELKVDSLEL